ncbi:MAG: beta-N-acetylglucosaminidase, partial [Acidobacteria bacterium]|nr:beta-N-acetylglucosaminidase [Acidobacteriota bacterium]
GASMRVANTVKFPHAMAYAAAGDPAATRRLAAFTAMEAHALGVHWILVPDADVNSNPENPIINIRSYGEDPRVVAQHVRAFIEGAHADPKHRVMTAAKHFPGHGDTAIDSHMGLPRLDVARERLDQVELVPFREAISAGTDTIMTAHIALTALDASGAPATISRPVLTDLLRTELGFKGIVVTDAMDMQALTRQYGPGETAVRAIEAGVDVLLMPADADEAIRAILAAIKSNRLSRRRIEESAGRILAAKVRVGLARKRMVDLEAINDDVGTPEAEEQAQSVADRAVTLVRNQAGAVPLAAPDSACFVVLAESRYSRQGAVLLEEVRKRAPKALTVALEPGAHDAVINQTIEKTSGCGQVVVAAFVSAAAYRGSVSLGGGFPRLVETLAKAQAPVTLVALGNPYLLRSFPDVAAYLATFSTVPPSEIAAVKALFGEISIGGKLPVTIPGLAVPGDGIQLRARAAPVR